MSAPPESKIAALLSRLPVVALGVLIAGSAMQTSCNETSDTSNPIDAAIADAASDDGVTDGDAPTFTLPSEDSPADRADGMSYGQGYGKMDAQVGPDARIGADAHVETDAHVDVDALADSESDDRVDTEGNDGSCVSSAATYPAAPGCPAGNHTWTCWPPTPAAGGISDARYTVLTLCGDVVVIDTNTHLMWGQEGEPGTYTWVGGAVACTGSRRGGFSDWRLPSSNELMSLVDYASSTQILDVDVFKGSYPTMWSSTASVQQAGNAWQLYASGGIYPQAVAGLANVRCVR